MTPDTIPQPCWLPALLAETQRLAERMRYFGMRARARSLTDGALAGQRRRGSRRRPSSSS